MGRVDEMLGEARDDVKHADQKASLLLAALGVGYGVILASQLSGDWVASEMLTPAGVWIWWAGVALAGAAVLSCVFAVWPRYKIDDAPTFGITYWGHVSAFGKFEDLEQAFEVQSASRRKRGLHQLWRLSRLVWVKYLCVRIALALAVASAVLLGVAVLVFTSTEGDCDNGAEERAGSVCQTYA